MIKCTSLNILFSEQVLSSIQISKGKKKQKTSSQMSCLQVNVCDEINHNTLFLENLFFFFYVSQYCYNNFQVKVPVKNCWFCFLPAVNQSRFHNPYFRCLNRTPTVMSDLMCVEWRLSPPRTSSCCVASMRLQLRSLSEMRGERSKCSLH